MVYYGLKFIFENIAIIYFRLTQKRELSSRNDVDAWNLFVKRTEEKEVKKR